MFHLVSVREVRERAKCSDLMAASSGTRSIFFIYLRVAIWLNRWNLRSQFERRETHLAD